MQQFWGLVLHKGTLATCVLDITDKVCVVHFVCIVSRNTMRWLFDIGLISFPAIRNVATFLNSMKHAQSPDCRHDCGMIHSSSACMRIKCFFLILTRIPTPTHVTYQNKTTTVLHHIIPQKLGMVYFHKDSWLLGTQLNRSVSTMVRWPVAMFGGPMKPNLGTKNAEKSCGKIWKFPGKSCGKFGSFQGKFEPAVYT